MRWPVLARIALIALVLFTSSACGVGNMPGLDSDAPPAGGLTKVLAPQFTEWRIWDPPVVASAPLEPDGEAFRVRPDWEVASIDYLYTWGGLGNGVRDYQRLVRAGQGYERHDGSPVSSSDLQALLGSLSQLHQSDGVANWIAGSDSYPRWRVLLTGVDGDELRLSSSSTGYSGAAPWNIEHNGMIYQQYDGGLAGPLSQLFPSERGAPYVYDESEGGESGQHVMTMNVVGQRFLPGQGIGGLFPLEIWQATDPGVGIHGDIGGGILGAGLLINPEHPEHDPLPPAESARIQAMELSLPDGMRVACSLEENQFPGWDFACPISGGRAGEPYRYPVTIEGIDTNSVEQKLSGTLWGTWSVAFDYALRPLSPDLAAALMAHAPFVDLLSDHRVALATYVASFDPAEPSRGRRQGELRLLGETAVAGQPVRYTVTTPFAVEAGAVLDWTLTRSELAAMLQTITASPLTRRVLDEDPRAVIDLWFAAGARPSDERDYFVVGIADVPISSFEATILPCADMPGGTFPAPGEPLRQFAFNVSVANQQTSFDLGTFRGNELTLVGDRVVVSGLALNPAYEPVESFHQGFQSTVDPARSLRSLIPMGLDVASGRGFDVIVFEGGPGWQELEEPELFVRIGDDSERTVEERAAVDARVQALPGALVEDDYESGWTARGVGVAIGDDGRLELVPCS